MEQEAPDELVGAERDCAVPRLPGAAVILVAEGHAALVERNEATVRDGDALGVDEPVLPLERCEMCVEGLAATQVLDLAKEREPALCMGIGEARQEEPPEQTGQYAHWQEEAGFAAHPARPVERYPAARHDHMDMRVMAPTPTIP